MKSKFLCFLFTIILSVGLISPVNAGVGSWEQGKIHPSWDKGSDRLNDPTQPIPLYDTNFTIDYTTYIADGIVSITADLDAYTKAIAFEYLAVEVQKDGKTQYHEPLTTDFMIPLTFGPGEYSLAFFCYVPEWDDEDWLFSIDIYMAEEPGNNQYLYSIVEADYKASTSAVPYYKELVKNIPDNYTKTKTIYQDLVSTRSYDYDFETNMDTRHNVWYTPRVDDAYDWYSGVCFHYASTLTGVLRSIGVPARIVEGDITNTNLSNGRNHAWVEALIDGTWIRMDPTGDLGTSDNSRFDFPESNVVSRKLAY